MSNGVGGLVKAENNGTMRLVVVELQSQRHGHGVVLLVNA